MPILAGAGGGPPTGVVDQAQPLTLTWIDPDGQSWDWSDLAGPIQTLNVAGYAGTPVAQTSLTLPSGSLLPQSYQGASRTIVVPLMVSANSQADFNALQDDLTRALWTERQGVPAPGTLIVQRPDGTARQIRALCTNGPDLPDEDRDKVGLTWMTIPATFRSVDPHWSDLTPIKITWMAGGGSAGVPPMPPITLSPAVVLGSSTVTNTGHADAWPTWTITGPGQPTITNTTTGRSWGLSVALGAGEVVTVVTAPDGLTSAVDGTGADRWGDLVKSSPRDLWPLVPGDNTLSVTLAGSASGSQVAMSYVRRWLRA